MKWSQRETKVCFLDFFFSHREREITDQFQFMSLLPYLSICNQYIFFKLPLWSILCSRHWEYDAGTKADVVPPLPASWSSLGRQREELNNPRTICKLVSGVLRESCIVLSKLMVGDLIKGGKAEWWIQKWMVTETKGGSEGPSEMKNYVVERELQAGGTACAKVWQWE